MKNSFVIEALMGVFALAFAVSAAEPQPSGEYQPRIDKDGWEILFDGKGLEAWTPASRAGGWAVNAEGELYPTKPGRDLCTQRRYCDYVIEADFKMGAKRKANSGVFIRVHDPDQDVNTGMEVQILDNGDYGVPFNAGNANGALYDLVRPAVDANKPIGEWNHFRITVNQSLVIVDLNGKEIVRADLSQWLKAGQNPGGGHNKFPYAIGELPQEGFILLQNYGATPVWFRNVRLKPISDRKPQYTGKEPIGEVLQKAAATKTNAAIALLPQPREVKRGPGQFTLKQDTAILADKDSPDAMSIGGMLAKRIRASTGLELEVSVSDSPGKQPGSIRITTRGADFSLGREGYQLNVAPDGVVITGSGAPGMFYGTQTLLQLLPSQVFSTAKVQKPVAWTIPTVRISDQPRFIWRGLLLDVARHFFSKEELKDFIDLMAQHKLNTLQVHLTDDQGWRIEIKRYPKLADVGGWRKSIGFGLAAKDGTAYGKDGRYGGFYTQDDIRELVAYAKARYVTIVPEIEMPGHSGAALSAYPEYSCFGGPYDRDSGPMGIYCPGNDATFTFLQDVLSEVMGLFPGKYIHIGADEVDQGNWTRCPKCKARIEQDGLKNEHELQSYFVKRIERFINAQGRTLIGWDEILEGGLAPNATVMSWRGIEGGVTAAKAGHDVIMTPSSNCYLDYYQAAGGEPRAIGGFLPLAQVYGYDPLPPGLPVEKAKHILGGGGNLWSEFFPNYAQVQYMAYPRACAIAELTWTDPKQKSWDDFKRRVQTQLERLKVQGVHYRAPKKNDAGW